MAFADVLLSLHAGSFCDEGSLILTFFVLSIHFIVRSIIIFNWDIEHGLLMFLDDSLDDFDLEAKGLKDKFWFSLFKERCVDYLDNFISTIDFDI